MSEEVERKKKLQELVALKKEHQRLLEDMLAKYDSITVEIDDAQKAITAEMLLLRKAGEAKRAEQDFKRTEALTGSDAMTLAKDLTQFLSFNLQ